MSRAISAVGILASVALSFSAACSADPPRNVEAPIDRDTGTGQPRDRGSDDAGRDGARPIRPDARASDGASDGNAPDAPDLPPPLDAPTRAALRALRYDDQPPPRDPSNAYAELPAARALGHRLFFDPSLSGRLLAVDNDGTLPTLGRRGEPGRTSCAGCHVPASGFFDTRSPHQQISLASQWTRRRTPTLLESAFLPVFNWDGRHDTPWSQAIGVMESPVEFNSSRLFIAQQMFRLHRVEYESVFGAMPKLDDTVRFPSLDPLDTGCGEGPVDKAGCRGKPGDGAEYDQMAPADRDAVTRVMVNAAKAIAAYVAQLRCGESRFDRWLDGEVDALTPSEQRGAALFVGRGRCASCHSGPRLTDGAFHNVGLRPATVAVAFTDTGDRGAAEGLALALSDPLESSGTYSDGARHTLPPAVTPAHEGAFRTPTLRCADRAPSFLHTGQMRTLEQVVTFFDTGGSPPPGYPGSNELLPLGLNKAEKSDLVAFLHTLTGSGPPAALLSPPAVR
jgi:cytochrome c peroxidase